MKKRVNFYVEKFSYFTQKNLSKRGVALSVETLLLIILAIAVLTLLLVFLNSRFGIFSEKIDSYSGESNVDDIILACNSLVTNGHEFSYCCEKKTIETEDSRQELTCDEFRQNELSSGRIGFVDCLDVNCG